MILGELLSRWSTEDKVRIIHSDTGRCIFEGTVKEGRYKECFVEYAAVENGELIFMIVD